MVQLVMVLRVRELERRAGEVEGPARRNDVSDGGVDCPAGLRRTEGAPRHRSEIFPLPYLQKRPAWSSGGLTDAQGRRRLRDVNGACGALNCMRGAENRPTALPLSLVANEDKNQYLRVDVQQRVILAALRWVGADSAVDEHEALAKLLEGRTGCAVQRRLL